MRRALYVLLLSVAMLAAVPAAGLAGYDAGGGQYIDPIGPGGGGDGGGNGNGGSGNGGGSSPAPVAPSTPGSTTAGAQGETTGPNAEASEIATAPGEIPRTGFPVGWLMLAGGMLVATGLGLRRVAGLQDA